MTKNYAFHLNKIRLLITHSRYGLYYSKLSWSEGKINIGIIAIRSSQKSPFKYLAPS